MGHDMNEVRLLQPDDAWSTFSCLSGDPSGAIEVHSRWGCKVAEHHRLPKIHPRQDCSLKHWLYTLRFPRKTPVFKTLKPGCQWFSSLLIALALARFVWMEWIQHEASDLHRASRYQHHTPGGSPCHKWRSGPPQLASEASGPARQWIVQLAKSFMCI